MEKPNFNYKQKPAIISFLGIYILCFVVSYFLIRFSAEISYEIKIQIFRQLEISHYSFLWNLPYGIILSLPFLIYGIRMIIWNLMSFYEINSTEIRILLGTLVRKEYHFSISSFKKISFKQNILEAPFGIGQIVLDPRIGSNLVLRGIKRVKSVVEDVRKIIDYYDYQEKPSRIDISESIDVSPPAGKTVDLVKSEEKYIAPKSQEDYSETKSKPEIVEVVHKQGGCSGCLIFMLIIILLPLFLAVVFKISIFVAILEFVRRIFSSFQ